jgi:hypothetical protein
VAGVQWIRLDTNMFSNPKLLRLIHAREYKAITAHMSAMCWIGGQGMDGFIPDYALADIKGATPREVNVLIREELWHLETGGWSINGWSDYQISDEDAQKRRQRAKKGGCIKNHGPECGCWRNA